MTHRVSFQSPLTLILYPQTCASLAAGAVLLVELAAVR